MTSERSAVRRESWELAGDAALTTAALLAVFTSLALLASQAVGDRELPVWLQVVIAATALIAGTAGPVIAWLLHGRRVTLSAVGGALFGPLVAGALVWVFVAVSTALGWIVSPISDAEWAGPLAGGGLVMAAFVALIVWLVLDGIRDYSRTREHPQLDVARAVFAFVVLAYSIVIVVLSLGETGGEIIEAIAFMLLGAINAAAVVTLADIATRLLERRPEAATAGEPA